MLMKDFADLRIPAVEVPLQARITNPDSQPLTSVYRGYAFSISLQKPGGDLLLSLSGAEMAKLYALLRDSDHSSHVRKEADYYRFLPGARSTDECQPAAWATERHPDWTP